MFRRAFVKRGIWVITLLAGVALLGPSTAPPPAPDAANAASLPAGFRETLVYSGLTNPTVVRFAPGGQIFVAEKSGIIKVFDNLSDTTPTVFADLNADVYNFWDRGLLGFALDPQFPTQPYAYALYSYDADIGGQAPKYGTAGVYSDPCPTPPGATTDGCVTSGRLVRLTATPSGGAYVMTGSQQALVNDWCDQFQTHSMGTVAFGADGALYASAGEGAGATFTDYGQRGSPPNPCGDPPGGVGAALSPPTAEGGSLRAQDLRTSGDPVGLDGSLIRVDPATGQGLPSNPLAGSSDPNARRIVAEGMRNPFRFAFRPGTSEPWIGDVGEITWEEINRVLNPSDSTVDNFGWPCFEGAAHNVSFDAADLTLCENMYATPGVVTDAYYAYNHSAKVVPGESCPTGSSSISGMAFESGGTYPAAYQGAVFFADYSRRCIWVMKKNGNAIPSPSGIETFVDGAAGPVDLTFGPDGYLYYVDLDGGTIRRIEPTSGTPPPAGTSYLSDLTWTSMTNQCGPVEKDRSNGDCAAGDGQTMSINGVTFPKGLGAHANSDVSYFLGGTCTRFKASIGIDDEVPASNGSVTFQVYADSNLVYQSASLNGTSATQTVDVSVAGASQLRLVLDSGANADWDHADWALARVDCGSSSDVTPPTITGQSPSAGATGVAVSTNVSATFSEAMNAATLTTSTFTLVRQGTTTPLAATVSYASQVATLDPTTNLAASTTYVATVKGGASGAKDVAGNALAADVSWSFTTGTTGGPNPPPAGTSYLSDLTWTSMTNHCGPVEKDRSNGNCAAGDGVTLRINGVSYAKGLGAHASSDVSYFLGGTCTRFKASIGIDDEVPASNGSVSFRVYADSTLVYQSASLNGTSATVSVDVSVAGASSLRLNLNSGANADWDHADWALARVDCGSGSDTTPPTITGQAPLSGATGVAVATNVSATFSEAMNPATLTTSTFTLVKQGTSTPLAATVSYASQVATLDPSADLAASTTYVATVKGGSSGAKDVAGNALAADVSWSFTTIAGANQPPTPIVDTPAVGTTWKVGDLISFTGHATDPEQGTLPASALSWSLVIQHCPSTCHTHPIQSWPGVTGASFNAPDHEYPSYLELRLTATDSAGSSTTTTLRLDPLTVVLNFGSSPSGLQLAVNSSASTTPFTRTVILGSTNTLSAITPQTLSGTSYTFSGWSDGGAQTHDVVAPAGGATYTATYGTATDVTPPTITGQSPLAGATAVAVATNVGATFSEAMNPATLTTSTFTLVRQGTSTPIAATVSYASQVATLDPSSDLAASTTYVATVKGGARGRRTSPVTRSRRT